MTRVMAKYQIRHEISQDDADFVWRNMVCRSYDLITGVRSDYNWFYELRLLIHLKPPLLKIESAAVYCQSTVFAISP